MHLDGKPIRSCVTPVGSAVGHKITTLEGLAATYHGADSERIGEASSRTTGLDRRTSAAMRELPERMDHVLGTSACHGSQTHRQSDSSGTDRAQMPLRLAGGNPSRGPARRESDGGGVMKKRTMQSPRKYRPEKRGTLSRRQFIQGHGRAGCRVFDAQAVR